MSLIGVASQAGTTSVRIEDLISLGEGSSSLAGRLGTTSAALIDFVAGTRVSPTIAQLLGTTSANAAMLREQIGREGAIGLILGLACGIGEER